MQSSNIPASSRIVGHLVRSIDQTHLLDFFGPWEQLSDERDARYRRMLDRIAQG